MQSKYVLFKTACYSVMRIAAIRLAVWQVCTFLICSLRRLADDSFAAHDLLFAG